jgi:hypothetical protein
VYVIYKILFIKKPTIDELFGFLRNKKFFPCAKIFWISNFVNLEFYQHEKVKAKLNIIFTLFIIINVRNWSKSIVCLK